MSRLYNYKQFVGILHFHIYPIPSYTFRHIGSTNIFICTNLSNFRVFINYKFIGLYSCIPTVMAQLYQNANTRPFNTYGIGADGVKLLHISALQTIQHYVLATHLFNTYGIGAHFNLLHISIPTVLVHHIYSIPTVLG